MVERTLISFPSQLQLIERLQHLFYLSSSMVFISGAKGSGKSTLVEQLSNQLPDSTKQAFIHLTGPTSVAQVRQQIVSQLFEHPLFDADESLFNILLLLKEKHASAGTSVIVIDNAQLLQEELLHELAEVIKEKLLLGDNEINFILLSDEFKSNQMVRQIQQSSQQGITTLAFKLSPLDINEAQQLLEHSLAQSNYSPKIKHQDALAKQLLNCQGNPEKILLLATDISSGHFDEKKPSWLQTRFMAILLMFALVALASGLVIYLYPQFIKPQVVVETKIESDAVLLDEIALTPLTTLTTDLANSSEGTEQLSGQWSQPKDAITDNKLIVGKADSGEHVIISGAQLPEVAYSTRAPTIDASIDDNIEANIEANIDVNIEANIDANIDANNETINSENSTIEKIVSNDKSPIADEPALEAVIDVESLEESPVTEPQALTSGVLATSPELLLAIDPTFYTLQLAAMGSEKALQQFIKQYQLTDKDIYFYQTRTHETNLYVLIYGQFENRQIALNEAKKLSELSIKLNSWPKKYILVHQDLQLNGQ
ncbi:MAG: AAA family ATPase [Psychromonas sp.]